MRGWLLPASAALHLVALAALLLWPRGAPGVMDAPPIEVVFMEQPRSVQGASMADAAAAPPPPGPDPGPREPPRKPASAQPAAPAVNLGDADETQDDLLVTGRGIVPPAPDSRYRNQPPGYPADAARAGATGTVGLLVQVSAGGLPVNVVVIGSSGTASLDRAARDAVRRWHFTPAQIQGTPVPFDYALEVRFVIGEKQ